MSSLFFLQTIWLSPVLTLWHPSFHLCLSIPSASHSFITEAPRISLLPVLSHCTLQTLRRVNILKYESEHGSPRFKILRMAPNTVLIPALDSSLAPPSPLCSSHMSQHFSCHGTHLKMAIFIYTTCSSLWRSLQEHKDQAIGQLCTPAIHVPCHPEWGLVWEVSAQHSNLVEEWLSL